jgi:hypothetical protein
MNKVDLFISEFRNWLKRENLNETMKIEFWNVDTSFSHYLHKLLVYSKKTNSFSCLVDKEYEKAEMKNKKFVVKANYNDKELSYAALHQTIRVGLFFNIFEDIRDLENYKDTVNFFVDFVNNKFELNFRNEFCKSDNIIEYINNNFKIIKENWRKYFEIAKEGIFIESTFRRMLSNLFYSDFIYRDDIDDNESLNIAEKFKLKQNTNAFEIIRFIKTNKSMLGSIKTLLNNSNDISFEVIEENKNMDLGYAGEIAFNYIVKHKNDFENLFAKSELKPLKFNKVEWTSSENKYSPYDFMVDNFATFEVKTTGKSLNKSQFILSSNEWDNILKQQGRGFICHLKSFDLNWVDYDKQELKDSHYINEENFKIFTLSELKSQFNFNSRGFYVREI